MCQPPHETSEHRSKGPPREEDVVHMKDDDRIALLRARV